MAWHRAITHNFAWKVASVILATLIWMTLRSGVQNRVRPERTSVFLQVPVTVLTGPGDNRAVRLEPSLVEVVGSASAQTLETLRAGDLQAFVNLIGPANATGRKRVQVQSPQGLTVVKVTPPEILVVTESQPAPPAVPRR